MLRHCILLMSVCDDDEAPAALADRGADKAIAQRMTAVKFFMPKTMDPSGQKPCGPSRFPRSYARLLGVETERSTFMVDRRGLSQATVKFRPTRGIDRPSYTSL